MTIDISDNSSRISYTVAQNVTQQSFAIPFEFFDDSDISVYVDETLKVITTDYSISGGNGSTGTVTFNTAGEGETQQVLGAAGGSTVTIVRFTTIERTTDFTTGADINRAALNTQLDTLTAIAADNKDRTDRALHISNTEIAPNLELPSINARKGRVLDFHPTSGAVQAGPLSNDIATIANNITEILAADSEAAAAAASATSASASASTATTKASEAAASATASETAKTAAETAETNAATSETNAASSAASASTDAGTATTKAGEAAASATASANSATASEAAKDAALAALDSFDDRYLGAKASDPTLDNDGNALVAGALYYNTTNDVMKVYEGSLWVAAYASLSGALLATNNLSDLDNAATARTNLGLGTAATSAATDFVAVTGDSMTGNLSFGDYTSAVFGNSNDLQIYHDGSDSYVKEIGAGQLILQGAAQVKIQSSATGDDMIKANSGADVALYHNNALKLATTSIGINVTGTVTATSFSGDGSALTGLPAGYTNSDVDTHLNYSTATTGQVLSYSGSDYDWVDAASGAGGGGSDEIFWENGQNVTTNYTITNGKNAMSAGPITIDSGVTVTVGAGETWTVV